jgi:hypothetical protein
MAAVDPLISSAMRGRRAVHGKLKLSKLAWREPFGQPKQASANEA